MGRPVKKPQPLSVFKKPINPPGKHLSHDQISKIKCFMDDPEYTQLDIAIAVGVRLSQVRYTLQKIREGQPLRNEFKDCPLKKGYIRNPKARKTPKPYLESF